MVLVHSIACNRIVLARSTAHKRKQANDPHMTNHIFARSSLFTIIHSFSYIRTNKFRGKRGLF